MASRGIVGEILLLLQLAVDGFNDFGFVCFQKIQGNFELFTLSTFYLVSFITDPIHFIER